MCEFLETQAGAHDAEVERAFVDAFTLAAKGALRDDLSVLDQGPGDILARPNLGGATSSCRRSRATNATLSVSNA